MKVADLPKEDHRRLRWGSHVPVLEALFDAFALDSVLELGAGLHSTPLFFRRARRVVAIEADAEWILRLVESGLAVDDRRELIRQPVPRKTSRRTLREKLPPGELARATAFYKTHMRGPVDLLFVDCYAGYRRQAVLDLYRHTGVVVFHDAEPEHDHQYGYSSMAFDPGWVRLTDRTWPAHTGILLSPPLAAGASRFRAALAVTAARYATAFGVEHEVALA